MIHRLFSIGGSLLLAGAMLGLMTEPVQAAQHGGHHGGGGHGGGWHGGGHGGWHGGGYRGGGWHHGGYYGGYHRGFYGGYHRGFYGGYWPLYGALYGYRPFYGSYYSYPYYGDYGWSSWGSPTYDYSPTYTIPYEDVTPSYSSGYTPETAPAADTAAHVTVRAPANARVWIGGWETPNTGTVRQFDSPPLTPGKQYSYEVKAQWEENGRTVTQTQNVDVSAGARSEAVFPLITPGPAGQAGGTAP